MPFALTPDQDLIRKTVRELAASFEGKPADDLDRERAFPKEALAALGQLGLTGMLVPAELGGPGTDTVSFALAIEEVARASGVVALALNNLNALGTYPLATRGSEEARSRFLAPALAGQQFLAWAMSEPGAGTDVGGVATRATKKGDAYALRGVKSFVVGAQDASAFITFAKAPAGLTAFVVPADAQGVRVAPPERTMAFRGSDMAQVFLNDVEVPAALRLGEEGAGLAINQQCGELASLGAAAIAVGIMQASLEDAIEYAGQREQFRMALKQFQAIQFLVAQLDLELRASRLLTWAAADKRDRGEDASADIAAAKLFAGEAAKHVTQKSLRIHGGAGFMRELPVERFNRDARATSIYAGTSEQERAILAAKALGL
jgi:alkylation response protein AidB-like acyl-CoA dehydrogenase